VDNKRNKKTFYTALFFAFVGFLLLLIITLTPEQYNNSSLVMKISYKTFHIFIQANPDMLILLIISGILNFLGYGIHGKMLGTFPFLDSKRFL
jgi:hypothetical protein